MEFPFNVNSVLSNEITVIRDGGLSLFSDKYNSKNRRDNFASIVNAMGEASAKAQGLRSPITTFDRFINTRQTLYIAVDSAPISGNGSVIGILKVGRKHLFLADYRGQLHEAEPLCVLDFYVHESKQRSGFGKILFEEMLKTEGKLPQELAIDRPSPKFLSFLRKHYHLCSHPKQANNFVVFDQFFNGMISKSVSNSDQLIKRNKTFTRPSESRQRLTSQLPNNLVSSHASKSLQKTSDHRYPMIASIPSSGFKDYPKVNFPASRGHFSSGKENVASLLGMRQNHFQKTPTDSSLQNGLRFSKYGNSTKDYSTLRSTNNSQFVFK